MKSEHGLEIGDDDWWKAAEKRVLRDTRRATRRARLKVVARWLPLVLVIAVVGAGGTWVVRNDRLPDLAALADRTDEAAEVVDPTLSDTELREPFVGTPAAPLLIEADGILLPEAHRVGRYGAAEVAARYRVTRELLILSRFDPRMVLRRDPSALLARLSRAGREDVAATLRRPEETGHLWVTRLAPGASLLAPSRVHGTMTARTGKNGELVVDTDYVFTYALKPPHDVYDRSQTHVMVRARVAYSFLDDRRFEARHQGVSLGDSEGYVFNMGCEQHGRGLLALPSDGEYGEGAPMPEEERARLYRADGPMPPSAQDCGRTTTPSPTPSVAGTPV